MPWISATKKLLFLFSHLNFLWYLGVPEKVRGGKIQKLVVSYRICFWWFQVFYFLPYRSQIFSTLEPFSGISGTLGYQKKYKWRKNSKNSGIIQNLFQMILSIICFPYWMVKLVKPVFKSQLWDHIEKYFSFAKLVSLFLNQANLVNSISRNNIKLFSCY